MADPNNPWGQTTDNPWPDEGTVAWTDNDQPQSTSRPQDEEWGQSPADSDWGETETPSQGKQPSQPDDAWDNPADSVWNSPADSRQDSQADASRNQETGGWGQASDAWNNPTDSNERGNPSAASGSNQWDEENPGQWEETAERTWPAATPDNRRNDTPTGERKHGSRKPLDRKKLIGIIIGVLVLLLVIILCHSTNTGSSADAWQEEWSSLVTQADRMADAADQSSQQARNTVTDIKTTVSVTPHGFAQYVAQAGRLEGDMSVLRSLEPQPAQTVGQTQTALTQALTPALTAVQQHAGAPSADPLKQLVSQWAAQTITSSNQTQAQQAITRIQQLTQQVDQNK